MWKYKNYVFRIFYILFNFFKHEDGSIFFSFFIGATGDYKLLWCSISAIYLYPEQEDIYTKLHEIAILLSNFNPPFRSNSSSKPLSDCPDLATSIFVAYWSNYAEGSSNAAYSYKILLLPHPIFLSTFTSHRKQFCIKSDEYFHWQVPTCYRHVTGLV